MELGQKEEGNDGATQTFISDRVEELIEEVSPSISPMKHYLNIINNHSDKSNRAYDNLLEKMEAVKELVHISDVFDYEEGNDEIGDESDPLFDGSLKQQEVALEDGQDELSSIPTRIYGSESLKSLLKEVCYEYKDIFSRFVKKDPAKVSPLTLDVDKLEWDRPFNKLPARPQSTANQDEIRKQLHKMLDLGVISPSTICQAR
jgi:hypothetical protein